MMHLYRPPYRKQEGRSFAKFAETTVKASLLLIYAAIPAAIVCGIWYYWLFSHSIHFNVGLRDIATAAWIPIFGIIYALLAAVVLNTVWSEYKSIRKAIKEYDKATFMNLCDEDMSPLIHVLMGFLSFAVLGAFMGLPYPDASSGFICIGSTALLFGLIFFVVIEIDNPLEGLWFIKNIHEEWMEEDVKTWRTMRWEALKKKK